MSWSNPFLCRSLPLLPKILVLRLEVVDIVEVDDVHLLWREAW